jgi:hypothetical protein
VEHRAEEPLLRLRGASEQLSQLAPPARLRARALRRGDAAEHGNYVEQL